MEINDVVAEKNRLGRTAARISVMVLALGFPLLGFLSVINKHQLCAGNGISFEHASSIIGGTISFLLGGVFLMAGSLHWNSSLPHAGENVSVGRRMGESTSPEQDAFRP
jgi:hypothetical protein